MDYQFDHHGNLLMIPDANDSTDIKGLLADPTKHGYDSPINLEKAWLVEQGFEIVNPEDVGALTSATLISDGTDIYGDMQYAVKSFLEELSLGNTVTWTKG
jgi:hypothetical protein